MRAAALLALIAAAAAAGFFAYRLVGPDAVTAEAKTPAVPLPAPVAEVVGDPRPDFSLPDYHGELRHASEWDGRLVVLNFWATWCPPCLEEIPEFIELQQRYGTRGVQFVGVAIDERDHVQEFAAKVGLNYPSLQHPTATLDLMRAYGNRQGGLPYTVIIGADGRIRFTRLGRLTREEAEDLIEHHLAG